MSALAYLESNYNQIGAELARRKIASMRTCSDADESGMIERATRNLQASFRPDDQVSVLLAEQVAQFYADPLGFVGPTRHARKLRRSRQMAGGGVT
jgi:hypothetical protein